MSRPLTILDTAVELPATLFLFDVLVLGKRDLRRRNRHAGKRYGNS
jgi:hypothetical protein